MILGPMCLCGIGWEIKELGCRSRGSFQGPHVGGVGKFQGPCVVSQG